MNMGHYLIFHRHAHPQIVLANVSSSIFFFFLLVGKIDHVLQYVNAYPKKIRWSAHKLDVLYGHFTKDSPTG